MGLIHTPIQLAVQPPEQPAQSMVSMALVAAIAIDLDADRGLPDRFDASIPAPYVEFLRERDPYARVTGGRGVLIPNYASSLGLFDVRYINSLAEAAFLAALFTAIPKRSPVVWMTSPV